MLKFPGKRPTNLGVQGGKMASCPSSPNCVSSQASDNHAIAPLRFSGDAQAALRKLKAVVEKNAQGTDDFRLAPEKGINAVHELAAQITRLEKWNDLRRGVTVNADIVSGGSRANVIAHRAAATLDLRAWRHADMRAIEKRLHALKPLHRGAKLEVRGGFEIRS